MMKSHEHAQLRGLLALRHLISPRFVENTLSSILYLSMTITRIDQIRETSPLAC
jgi:sensor histidine kinase YesM